MFARNGGRVYPSQNKIAPVMTVSDVYEDHRKPTLPYTITIRYGRTMSLIEYHRFPTRTMAEEAAAMIREHGLDRTPWPSHFRPAG